MTSRIIVSAACLCTGALGDGDAAALVQAAVHVHESAAKPFDAFPALFSTFGKVPKQWPAFPIPGLPGASAHKELVMNYDFATWGSDSKNKLEVHVANTRTPCSNVERDNVTHQVCRFHQGDPVEVSLSSRFNPIYMDGDVIDIQFSTSSSGLPFFLQGLVPQHPQAMHISCPVCGGACDFDLDDVMPGGRAKALQQAQLVETMFPKEAADPQSLVNFFLKFLKAGGYTLERPHCPIEIPINVDAPTQRLNPITLPPPLATLLEQVQGHLNMKVEFKHSDGNVMLGVSSVIDVGHE